MTDVLRRRGRFGHRHVGRTFVGRTTQTCDDRGRDCRDVATSQWLLATNRSWQRQGWLLPYSFLRKYGPVTLRLQTSGLQYRETMTLYGFRPPSWGFFVTAATGNSYSASHLTPATAAFLSALLLIRQDSFTDERWGKGWGWRKMVPGGVAHGSRRKPR